MIVSFGQGPTTLTGPIIDGYVLRQSFVAIKDVLSFVRVLFSTYKRSNKGAITAEIVDSHNRSVASSVVVASALTDNSWHEFKFYAPLVPGATYEFRLKTLHCRSGQAPTAHYSSEKHGFHLFVGGKLTRHMELTCEFGYEGNRTTNIPSGRLVKQDGRVISFLRGTNPLLSVIILNKDGRDLIQKCVDAVISNTDYEDIEIIIGDTGTTDPEVLEYYGHLPPNVRVISGLNYHFSKNNNLLAKEHAEGDHLLFLNNDVFLEPDAITAMMNYIRIYTVGAVGLRLLKPRGVIDHDGQVLFKDGVLATPDHLNVNFPPELVVSEDVVTDGVTAACVLTRRDLFTDLGGFDEGYQDVYQDCDYCMKLTDNGFLCVTVRTVSAEHMGSATRGETRGEDPVVVRDRERFFSRWEGFEHPETPKFSFITCCNNPQTYSGFMSSIDNREQGEIELVPVNNHDNLFTVTESLNLAALVARGKWLVYCHQDIILCDKWTMKVLSAISHIPPGVTPGIIGFEGLQYGGTPRSCTATSPDHPQVVQTLDELCLITDRRDLMFDENFLFHYYGADICLQAEAMGFTNFLIGVPTKHLSGGSENVLADIGGFKLEAENFSEKWRNKNVWTTTTKFLDGGIIYMIVADVLNEVISGKD